ncbi:chaperone protein dnaK-like [Nicotiana tomentosiformis]|uniref:chaperone protein dnaK-like n=1 Tax=Nicotiana tomentosiformis TaxID=4098 RepID=UPI00388C7779
MESKIVITVRKNKKNEAKETSVAGTDCDSSEEEEGDELVSSDYYSEELEMFRNERTKEVNEKLDMCFISKDEQSQTIKIKTLNQNHDCDPVYQNRRGDSKTLVHYFKRKIQNNPMYKIKDMRGDLEGEFKLNVSKSKMKRVKRIVLEKLEGSYLDDDNRLEAYTQELRESNVCSDVVVNISKEALTDGLDGTFLKGKCKGQLLVVVGQDSGNHFYPITWAVVDKETNRTWSWFVEMLKILLDLKDGEEVTFISNMQKGLLDVISVVVPKANHRFCVRHVEAN